MKVGDIVIQAKDANNPTAERGVIERFVYTGLRPGTPFPVVRWPNAGLPREMPSRLIVLPPPQDAASQLDKSKPPAIKAGDRVTFMSWRSGFLRGGRPEAHRVSGLVLAREGDDLFIRADEQIGFTTAHPKRPRQHTTRGVEDVEREVRKPIVYADGTVQMTVEVRAALTEKGLL